MNCPPVDKLLWKNPVYLLLGKLGWYNKVTPTVPFAQRRVTARLDALSKLEKQAPTDNNGRSATKQIDLLAKFLRAKNDFPDTVDDRAVLGLTLSMVNAGSDTTATTLAAIFYHLLNNPEPMRKLISELDTYCLLSPNNNSPAALQACISTFAEAQKLPYLDACIKETFRLHPALGGQLSERVVPPSGATISGSHIPGGTTVSSSSWLVHRHKPTFGDDADLYRPERWLHSSHEQLSAMNKALLTFGAGPHTCVGKNIALLEIYKLVPSVLRAFEVGLRHWPFPCSVLLDNDDAHIHGELGLD